MENTDNFGVLKRRIEAFSDTLPREVSKDEILRLLDMRDYFTKLPIELIMNIMDYLPSQPQTFCLINKHLREIALGHQMKRPREISTLQNEMSRSDYYRSARMASSADYLAWIPDNLERNPIYASLQQLSPHRMFSKRFIINTDCNVPGCNGDVLLIRGIALQGPNLLTVTGPKYGVENLGIYDRVQIWHIDIENLRRTSECVLPYRVIEFPASACVSIRTVAWKEDTLLIQSIYKAYVCHLPVNVAQDEENKISMHWEKSLKTRPYYSVSVPEDFAMLDANGQYIFWFSWDHDVYRFQRFDLQGESISSNKIKWKYHQAQSPSSQNFPKVMSGTSVLVANHWRKNFKYGMWSTTLLNYDLIKNIFVISEFSDIDLRILDYRNRLDGISQVLCIGKKIFFWTYTPERTFNVFDTQNRCHQRMAPRELRLQVSLSMKPGFKTRMHMENSGSFVHTAWGNHLTVYKVDRASGDEDLRQQFTATSSANCLYPRNIQTKSQTKKRTIAEESGPRMTDSRSQTKKRRIAEEDGPRETVDHWEREKCVSLGGGWSLSMNKDWCVARVRGWWLSARGIDRYASAKTSLAWTLGEPERKVVL